MGNNMVVPEWPAPENVGALVTTRHGGVSEPPYDSFNLGKHVGDQADHVEVNRERLQGLIKTPHRPQWLQQVHGNHVVVADTTGKVKTGDACITQQVGLPCAVMTADCLPVLFCTHAGDKVGVAHAGWRGLAGGVIEATLAALSVPNARVLVWLGPAIGPKQFEVGNEVREAFVSRTEEMSSGFCPHPTSPNKWLADIYRLARIHLLMNGVEEIYGGEFCTLTDQQRFFSYRRDGETGRMASVIWRKY